MIRFNPVLETLCEWPNANDDFVVQRSAFCMSALTNVVTFNNAPFTQMDDQSMNTPVHQSSEFGAFVCNNNHTHTQTTPANETHASGAQRHSALWTEHSSLFAVRFQNESKPKLSHKCLLICVGQHSACIDHHHRRCRRRSYVSWTSRVSNSL